MNTKKNMKSLTRHCEQCQDYQEIEFDEPIELKCPNCSALWGRISSFDKIFQHCPICMCRQFYISKDFDKFIGILIVLIGVILIPVTYGLSLPVVAVIIWQFYKRIKNFVSCYKCGTEFRGFEIPPDLKPFMPPIGSTYAKFKGTA